MAEQKTKRTSASVAAFLAPIDDVERRKDAKTIDKLLREITGDKPKMWGPSIVGYGSYHYRYASGREGDWMRTGFSPRKSGLTIYIMGGLQKRSALLKKLGKHKTGKSCLYLGSLEHVDMDVLRELVRTSVDSLG